jgi:hypothetical protein
MVEVEIKVVGGSDKSDPLSDELMTLAAIVDGDRRHCLKAVSKKTGGSDGTAYRRDMNSLLQAVISEAYRIGKEAR